MNTTGKSTMLKMSIILLLAGAAPAAAHVALAETTAPAGSYSVATFRAGHGCGDAPTVAVTIAIPAAVVTARPQPKPGWSIEVARSGDKVTAITWKGGPLPADQFDAFAMLLHLPDAPGALAFPVTQTCTGAVAKWDQPPGGDSRFPAPVLTVTAPDPHAGMHHGQ